MKPFSKIQYSKQAFTQFSADAGAYIGIMLLAATIYLILSIAPMIGGILPTLVCTPMIAGIFLFIRSHDTGETPNFSKFFGVFSNRYYLAFISQHIFVTLISIIGFGAAAMLFIGDQLEAMTAALEQLQSKNQQEVVAALELIIGSNFGSAFMIGLLISVVISTLYFFAPLFVILHDLSFWASLEASRQYATKRF